MTQDKTADAPPQEATAPVRGRTAGDVLRLVCSGLGQLLITAGVVILLFVGYELWFTGLYTEHQQQVATKSLTQQFATEQAHPAGGTSSSSGTAIEPFRKSPNGDVVYPTVAKGSPETILYVPRLGSGYHYVVVEGVGVDDLKKGPGHYPGTPLPGQLGNVVVSGHRTTYLAPFNRFDELRPGDPVIFEMADGWYTYTVTGTRVVAPTDTFVIDNPFPAGVKEPARTVTFTTCNPKYSARQRLVVYGTFVKHTPFSQPPSGVVPVKGG